MRFYLLHFYLSHFLLLYFLLLPELLLHRRFHILLSWRRQCRHSHLLMRCRACNVLWHNMLDDFNVLVEICVLLLVLLLLLSIHTHFVRMIRSVLFECWIELVFDVSFYSRSLSIQTVFSLILRRFQIYIRLFDSWFYNDLFLLFHLRFWNLSAWLEGWGHSSVSWRCKD